VCGATDGARNDNGDGDESARGGESDDDDAEKDRRRVRNDRARAMNE